MLEVLTHVRPLGGAHAGLINAGHCVRHQYYKWDCSSQLTDFQRLFPNRDGVCMLFIKATSLDTIEDLLNRMSLEFYNCTVLVNTQAVVLCFSAWGSYRNQPGECNPLWCLGRTLPEQWSHAEDWIKKPCLSFRIYQWFVMQFLNVRKASAVVTQSPILLYVTHISMCLCYAVAITPCN